jgi:hypothetical protein
MTIMLKSANFDAFICHYVMYTVAMLKEGVVRIVLIDKFRCSAPRFLETQQIV